jgi:uncharacterized membrane protein (UPF0127 family)
MRFALELVFLDREGREIRRLHAVPAGRVVRERRADAVLELPADPVRSRGR